jgi:ABC-type anion transport system duplicated permease subunit
MDVAACQVGIIILDSQEFQPIRLERDKYDVDVTCHELKISLTNFNFFSELTRKTRTVARTAACSESVNKQRKKEC